MEGVLADVDSLQEDELAGGGWERGEFAIGEIKSFVVLCDANGIANFWLSGGRRAAHLLFKIANVVGFFLVWILMMLDGG